MSKTATNSRGVSPKTVVTARSDMAAFDQLPKPLRMALANSAFDWAATPLVGKNVDADIIPEFDEAEVELFAATWRGPAQYPHVAAGATILRGRR